MSKLHELLAAEKTPTAAWNKLHAETLAKFGNTDTYFHGHSRSLSMLESTPANEALESQARDEKPVTTTVYDTLKYALDIFARAEDLQYQKNATNRAATGTVMWRDQPWLLDLPVDELLGLEARLTKIRELYERIPTIDASKHWKEATQIQQGVWEVEFPEETLKTEKILTPIIMHPATAQHPAQVQAVPKDVVVGKFTTVKRSGAATAYQKAEAIKRIDELIIEVKKARMRANETLVIGGTIAAEIVDKLLEPLRGD